MVPAKETAEEQLLRMIEGPGRPPVRGPQGKLSFDRLLEQAREGIESVWRWARSSQRRGISDAFLWRLQLTERVFWLILAGLGIYLVVDLLVLQLRPPTFALRPGPAGIAEPGDGSAIPGDLKPVEEYRRGLVSRNPFQLSAKAAAKAAEPAVKSALETITATLKVVGLNRGRVPEALIEDSAAKRTYFVKVGDQVNSLTVKAIDKRGVTVVYQDEETLLQ